MTSVHRYFEDHEEDRTHPYLLVWDCGFSEIAPSKGTGRTWAEHLDDELVQHAAWCERHLPSGSTQLEKTSGVLAFKERVQRTWFEVHRLGLWFLRQPKGVRPLVTVSEMDASVEDT